ncbi:MAG TPA: SDR family oxidoreductase [Ignavibacteria bacterium]|nr:SDR family oxidoreductase [Ignavibacteria bacterium]
MILITGASRGIGKFLFDEFVKSGEEVYGTYFSENKELENNESYFRLDVSDYDQTSKIINNLGSKLNKIVLINCAGNNYNCFAHKSSPQKWNEVISTNLTGTYNMIRAALPVMREQGYGRIINFSSIVAESGIPGTSAYAASKAGLWGMTRSIAVENASKGITINNLNLGYFDIGMIAEVSEEYQKIVKSKIPTGKFGDPENIHNAVKFIIESDYINGTSVDINGGIY